MAATLADLVVEAPPAGAGVELAPGVRFVVQLAVMEQAITGARWDAGRWDQQAWAAGTWAWVDVTCDVRLFTSERGRDAPLERFRVGAAVVGLDNRDRKYSTIDPPATSPYVVGGRSMLGAGTLMRAGFLIGAGWRPAFTGPAEQWPDVPDYDAGDRHLPVVLTETTNDLAGVDRAEQPAQGDSESPGARLDRLLDDAGWRWPRRYAPVGGAEGSLQATTMAGNRLAECYLTADSIRHGRFYADGDGAARYDGTNWSPPAGAIGTIGIRTGDHNPTRIVLADDTLRITNDVQLARAGGTAQRVIDSASRDRFGPRTYQRFDLLTFDDPQVATIAADVVTRTAWDVRRTDEATLNYPASVAPSRPDRLPTLASFMARVQLRDIVNLYGGSAVTESTVEAIRHYVDFTNGSPPTWELTVALIRRVPAGPYG